MLVEFLWNVVVCDLAVPLCCGIEIGPSDSSIMPLISLTWYMLSSHLSRQCRNGLLSDQLFLCISSVLLLSSNGTSFAEVGIPCLVPSANLSMGFLRQSTSPSGWSLVVEQVPSDLSSLAPGRHPFHRSLVVLQPRPSPRPKPRTPNREASPEPRPKVQN